MLQSRETDARVHSALVIAALAGLALYTALVAAGVNIPETIDTALFHGTIATAGFACLVAAARRDDGRAPWIAFGAGLVVWAASDIYLVTVLDDAHPTFPSLPDFGFLLTLFLFYLGAFYLCRGFDRLDAGQRWLDGAIAALGVTAVATALIGPTIAADFSLDAQTTAVNFTYSVADFVLVGIIMATMVVTGRTGSRTLLTVAAALLLWAASDTSYLIEVAGGTYDGGLIDLGWICGAWLIALASLHSAEPRWATEEETPRSFPAIPALSAALAVTILIWDHFERIESTAIWFAGATLVAVTARLLASSREIDHLVARLRHDARTDPLTGLRNRRILFTDLEKAIIEGSRLHVDYTFALFDLNGFKSYNDTFGHPAGDQLLRRLGARLATVVGPTDGVYRLGGDEFCLLTAHKPEERDVLIEAARDALTEVGEGFTIEASCGVVAIPQEARSSAEAFRLADDRMYAEKALRANRNERSAHDVLLSALQERDGDLTDHLEQVGMFAARTAEEMGLPVHEVETIRRAGELHDIGKIAIPDQVLDRPGPLGPDERELIRRHTIIGQRILAVVPGLDPVGKLLRSAHERWDGRGYPDGLAGEDIPLGARIIFVSDAFDAMTSERPYQEPVDVETALAELHRSAGTQFDPRVVAAFERAVRSELSLPPHPELADPAGTGFSRDFERSSVGELPVEAEGDVVWGHGSG
jgi:two-component system, cell cycle response regulator